MLVKLSEKGNKLSSTYQPDIYKVVNRKESEVTIQDSDFGALYRRNVSHLKRVNGTKINQDQNDDLGTAAKKDDTDSRPKRKTQRPNYLSEYVNLINII